MNMFNSLYYYINPYQQTETEVVSNKTDDICLIENEKEVEIIECNLYRDLTPDTTETLDICNPRELQTDVENKTIEEIIQHYENDKILIDNLINDIKFVECKCNILFILFIISIVLQNSNSSA